MNEYHKIQTVYNRNPETKFKTLLEGEYSRPEFEYLANNEWIFTEKVDGTNIRINCSEEITFGGRTDNAQIPAFLVTQLERLFHYSKIREVIADSFPDGAVLYGEGYGGKIQKGSKYRVDQSFVLFDVKVGEWWLQRKDVEDIAEKLKIDIVPILGEGTLQDMVNFCKQGIISSWGDFQAEGYVARPVTELKARNGQRIITKIKCRDFV